MGCVPPIKRQQQSILRNSQAIMNNRSASASSWKQLNKSIHQQPLRVSTIKPLPSMRNSQIMLPSNSSILSNKTMLTSQSSRIAQSPSRVSSIIQGPPSFLPSQGSINSLNQQYYGVRPPLPHNKSSRKRDAKKIIQKNVSSMNNQNFQQIHVQKMSLDNLRYE